MFHTLTFLMIFSQKKHKNFDFFIDFVRNRGILLAIYKIYHDAVYHHNKVSQIQIRESA